MTDRISAIVNNSIEVKRRFFDEHSDDVRRAAEMISNAFKSGGKLLVFGNGGSAADAQHIVGELVNRFLLKRKALRFCSDLRRPTRLLGFAAVAGLVGFLFYQREREFFGRLVGREARGHTGWLVVGDGRERGLYAPHTGFGFRAPGNKTLLLLANGFLAKRGLRQARRQAGA